MGEMNPVKGMRDYLGEDMRLLRRIEDTFLGAASLYGYQEIETPILENVELFRRGAGEGTDIVRKEMYELLDKGGRPLALRPELTAGIMRAIMSEKLHSLPDMPLRLCYFGPAFRYERPQLGRLREFHQFGVEAVGADSPALDAETIALLVTGFRLLGFQDLRLLVNSLGDKGSRDRYREALRDYFRPHLEEMCEDCKERFRLNPLRMLDCKVMGDQELAKGAPSFQDYLGEESRKRFEETLRILDSLGIPYEIDPGLVRGLDYYSETVYEVHLLSPSGKDYGALGGGGHYGGLLKELGGPDLPGVGFAIGAERVLALMKELGLGEEKAREIEIAVLPVGEEALPYAQEVSYLLRGMGFATETPLRAGKLGAQFRRAERKGARVALILGEEEMRGRKARLKDLRSEEQEDVPLERLQERLDQIFGEEEEEDGHEE